MKVGFLFNHYVAYQVQHGAPYAFQLSRLRPDYQVEILCSTDEAVEEVKRVGRHYPGSRCSVRNLKSSVIARILTKNRFNRSRMLLANLHRLLSFDALVAPEKLFLFLKSVPGFGATKFIGLRHGAGDRPMPELSKGDARFDGLLVPGRSYYDRYKDQVPAGRCEIVGYPKFELVERTRPDVPRLFGNDLPTVLYTPHFNPEQSSWLRAGREVLQFFAEREDLNLIFAPHVRLFQRAEFWGGISPGGFLDRPNMLVDTGSERSVDMTYLRAADLYLGDVSSQVYEFIYLRRRPCVFLNLHGLDAAQMPFWRFGPVIDEVAGLAGALDEARRNFADEYEAEQDRLVELAFSTADAPPSQRGAEAIVRILNS